MKKWIFISWVLIIFIITSIPVNKIPHIQPAGLDKISHVFLYSVLTISFIYSFNKRRWSYFPIIIIIALIDEFHQYFIPGRIVSVYDFIADLVGGISTFWVLKE